METTVQKAWLTYQEAQEFAGIGRTLLFELVRDGEITASKVGNGSKRKTVRISRESLDAYMKRNRYTK